MARPATDLDSGRNELLDILTEIIRTRGVASVSLADLAAAADMSPANIYRFFPSREALYEAVAERWFAPKIRVMEEAVARPGPVREKLYQFFAGRFAMMRDDYRAEPELFVSYLNLGDEHEEIVRGYIDLGDHYLAMLVSEAMEDGHFEGLSIDEAVSLINLMLTPFINPRVMIDVMHSVTEVKLGRVINALLSGLRANEVATRPAPRISLV